MAEEMTRDEMIEWLSQWVRRSGLGDAGESPSFDISYDGKWGASAYSSYDGSGYSTKRAELNDALKEVIEEVQAQPEQERASEFNSAAWAVARWKHISRDKAIEWLREKS